MLTKVLQGYLAHKKTPLTWTLQWAYAYGPAVVLGGGSFSYERGTHVGFRDYLAEGSDHGRVHPHRARRRRHLCEGLGRTYVTT